MGTAVKDHKTGIFLEHKTLFMGKTVFRPFIPLFQIHVFALSCFLHGLPAVGDKPDTAARLTVSGDVSDSVLIRFQQSSLYANIFHTAFLAVIAILSAGFSHIEFCFPVLLEEDRHPVRMVVMRVGKHCIVRISQIYAEFLCVFRKETALACIQKYLLISVFYIKA